MNSRYSALVVRVRHTRKTMTSARTSMCRMCKCCREFFTDYAHGLIDLHLFVRHSVWLGAGVLVYIEFGDFFWGGVW